MPNQTDLTNFDLDKTEKARKQINKPVVKIKKVIKLISKGANPNITNAEGQNLAHIIMKNPMTLHGPFFLREFKRYSGNLYTFDYHGLSPIMYAISSGTSTTFTSEALQQRQQRLELVMTYIMESDHSRNQEPNIIDALVTNFANLNISHHLLDLLSSGNTSQSQQHRKTVLDDYRFSLLEKPHLNKSDYKLLLNKDGTTPMPANTQNSVGMNLVHLLVKASANDQTFSPGEFESLLKDGGASIHETDNSGQTPLQYLLDQLNPSNIKLALLLVNEGANPNTKNKDGKTLLLLLAEKFPQHLDSYLTSRLEANADLEKDFVPLEQLDQALEILTADLSGHNVLAAINLVRLGASPNNKPKNGKPFLHALVLLNVHGLFRRELEALLNCEKSFTNPDITNSSGESILELLYKQQDFMFTPERYTNSISQLLKAGARLPIETMINRPTFNLKQQASNLISYIDAGAKISNIEYFILECVKANQGVKGKQDENLSALINRLLDLQREKATPAKITPDQMKHCIVSNMNPVHSSQNLIHFDELENPGWTAKFD